MNVSCRLGFHKWSGCQCQICAKTRDQDHDWSGCKCGKCGSTRDEGHDWRNDCDKCSRCGSTRQDAHQWSGCKCSRCGRTRDQGHDWGKDCENCCRCGKTQSSAHEWQGCKCAKCGKTRHEWSGGGQKCLTCGAAPIGSRGPGGGVIFHVSGAGDSGLEARPASEDRPMPWPNAADYLAGLIRRIGPGWRLPSIEELQLLYDRKEAVGDFSGDFHWSSTQLPGDRALSLVDRTGQPYPLRKRGDSCYVRAIRAFGPGVVSEDLTEATVKVRSSELVTWSKHWGYNYAKNFSSSEKDEILESVRTEVLHPDPKSADGYTVENSKFSVYVYFTDGAWEINGAKRK